MPGSFRFDNSLFAPGMVKAGRGPAIINSSFPMCSVVKFVKSFFQIPLPINEQVKYERYIIKNWDPRLCFGSSECAYGLKCLKEIIPLGC